MVNNNFWQTNSSDVDIIMRLYSGIENVGISCDITELLAADEENGDMVLYHLYMFSSLS